MRSTIASITMLATVMHFTLGCCLHVPHASASDDCCGQGLPTSETKTCCDDHDHASQLIATDRAESHLHGHPGPLLRAARAEGCDGCTCAATKPEADAFQHWSPALAGALVKIAMPCVATLQGSRGDCRTAGLPIPSALRPPLYERFLV